MLTRCKNRLAIRICRDGTDIVYRYGVVWNNYAALLTIGGVHRQQ